jgi:hypothetical protein
MQKDRSPPGKVESLRTHRIYALERGALSTKTNAHLAKPSTGLLVQLTRGTIFSL